MHSHHSHSGDYVSHASDTLEQIIDKVQSMGFTHYCLTEHMPRLSDKFLYPEELEKGYKKDNLFENFEKYLTHATELQHRHNNTPNGVKLLVGFEIEGLDDEHIDYTLYNLLNSSQYNINMTVGSVHYVHSIPIDFSPELWLEAREQTNEKTTRSLYKDYFELQFKVIEKLKPTVLGHFDLIRLFEPVHEIDPTTGKELGQVNLEQDWPEVWGLVVRNIEYAAKYGALFELNSAAIRKGWKTPYPKEDIARAIIKHGQGRFCLSDDAHAIKQVGLNYHVVRDYVTDVLNLPCIYYLDLDDHGNTVVKTLKCEDFEDSSFWLQQEYPH